MKSRTHKILPALFLLGTVIVLTVMGYVSASKDTRNETVYGIKDAKVVELLDKGNTETIVDDGKIYRALKLGSSIVYINEKGINTKNLETGASELIRPDVSSETSLMKLSEKEFIYFMPSENQENTAVISTLKKDDTPKVLSDKEGKPYEFLSLSVNEHTKQVVFVTLDYKLHLYSHQTDTFKHFKHEGNKVGFLDDNSLWVSVSPSIKEETSGKFFTVDPESGKASEVKEQLFTTITVLAVERVDNKQIILALNSTSKGSTQSMFTTDLKFKNEKLLLNLTKLGLNSSYNILPYTKDTAFMDFRAINREFSLSFELGLDGKVRIHYKEVSDIFV